MKSHFLFNNIERYIYFIIYDIYFLCLDFLICGIDIYIFRNIRIV